MRRRTALGGIIVAASLAIAGSASAQTATWALWKNANTANGTFYMGVAGGPKCNATTRQCWVVPGTQIITWVASQGDQYMGATVTPFGVITAIQDFYKDLSGNPMCLGVAGNSHDQNANIVVTECQNATQGPSQYWEAERAEDLGAPYPGCVLFNNRNSTTVSMVLSVFQGSVKNGSRVIQFPMCVPSFGGNTCGFPPNEWHADQFWCPVQPTIIP